eukprot:303434_1
MSVPYNTVCQMMDLVSLVNTIWETAQCAQQHPPPIYYDQQHPQIDPNYQYPAYPYNNNHNNPLHQIQNQHVHQHVHQQIHQPREYGTEYPSFDIQHMQSSPNNHENTYNNPVHPFLPQPMDQQIQQQIQQQIESPISEFQNQAASPIACGFATPEPIIDGNVATPCNIFTMDTTFQMSPGSNGLILPYEMSPTFIQQQLFSGENSMFGNMIDKNDNMVVTESLNMQTDEPIFITEEKAPVDVPKSTTPKKKRNKHKDKNYKVSSDGGVITCTVGNCGKKFKKISTWYSHHQALHAHGTFSCTKSNCANKNVFFNSKAELKDHIKQEHPPMYPCSYHHCGETFFTEKSLKRHINQAHKCNFVCPVCARSMASGFRLTQHIRIFHQGLRPYKCPICASKFSTQQNMLTHVRRMHKN